MGTVQKLGPWKCGAVVAGICEIDFRDTTGSVNSGEEGDLVYLVVLLVKLLRTLAPVEVIHLCPSLHTRWVVSSAAASLLSV